MDKLYLAIFSIMEETYLSIASEERSQGVLSGFFSACKYTRWMQRYGLLTYCSAREEINAWGKT
jgi:hypothetical protein